MSLVIGLAGRMVLVDGKLNPVIRGLLLGTVVSFATLLGGKFFDPMGFFAGVAYGLIIDLTATRFGDR